MAYEEYPIGDVIALTGEPLSGQTTLATKLKGHISHLGMGVGVSLVHAEKRFVRYEDKKRIVEKATSAIIRHPAAVAVTIIDDLQSYDDFWALDQTFGDNLHLFNIHADEDIRRERGRQLVEQQSNSMGKFVMGLKIQELDEPRESLTDLLIPTPITLTNNTPRDLQHNVKFIAQSLRTANRAIRA